MLQSNTKVMLPHGFNLDGIARFGSCPNHEFKVHGTDSAAIFIQAFYNSRTHGKLLIKENFQFSAFSFQKRQALSVLKTDREKIENY
jgi:hypothetical protein